VIFAALCEDTEGGMGQSRHAWRCAESWRPERGSVRICVALCGETESERASTEVPWPSAKRRGLEPPHTDVHDLLRRDLAIGRFLCQGFG